MKSFKKNQMAHYAVVLILVSLVSTATTFGGWNPLKKPLAPITDSADKVGKYISKQVGNEKIQANINGASTEAKKTAEQAQQALNDLSPAVKGAAEGVKQTTIGVSELLRLIKWPIFVLTIAAAVWMSGKAFAVWKASPIRG